MFCIGNECMLWYCKFTWADDCLFCCDSSVQAVVYWLMYLVNLRNPIGQSYVLQKKLISWVLVNESKFCWLAISTITVIVFSLLCLVMLSFLNIFALHCYFVLSYNCTNHYPTRSDYSGLDCSKDEGGNNVPSPLNYI